MGKALGEMSRQRVMEGKSAALKRHMRDFEGSDDDRRLAILSGFLPEPADGMVSAVDFAGAQVAQLILYLSIERIMKREKGYQELHLKLLDKLFSDKKVSTSTKTENISLTLQRAAREIEGMDARKLNRVVREYDDALRAGEMPIAEAEYQEEGE